MATALPYEIRPFSFIGLRHRGGVAARGVRKWRYPEMTDKSSVIARGSGFQQKIGFRGCVLSESPPTLIRAYTSPIRGLRPNRFLVAVFYSSPPPRN